MRTESEDAALKGAAELKELTRKLHDAVDGFYASTRGISQEQSISVLTTSMVGHLLNFTIDMAAEVIKLRKRIDEIERKASSGNLAS